MSDQVDRVCKLANQLLGDLERAETEQQKLQAILDSFEQVGVIALDSVGSSGGPNQPPDDFVSYH
jgi:hypothetical protein